MPNNPTTPPLDEETLLNWAQFPDGYDDQKRAAAYELLDLRFRRLRSDAQPVARQILARLECELGSNHAEVLHFAELLASPPHPEQPVSEGCALIAIERKRQIGEEGYNSNHDEEHDPGELVAAGAAYAINAADQLHPYSQGDGANAQPQIWPWSEKWWKPKEPLRDLVRAGALIAAEIDKLLAAAPQRKEDKL